MADLDSLYNALRNADAAGDTEGAKRLAQYIQQVQTSAPVEAPPKTTAFGHAKELAKGIVPGAVGLLETAATGISALLPEETEKAARAKIASMATAAKTPFAAAPGYEDSVSRKLSEGIGSTAPFFALGPLGPAARAAAAGLGVAAGAGEARQSAEEAGATGKERSVATLLGAPTGLLDLLAPEIKPLKGVITTALARGGVEGATEAAQKIAQNLIAKGVYNPNQGILTGSGEEGAYGAGIGALTSLILDLTIPGRQRAYTQQPKQTPPPAAEPGPQLAPEAPKGTQGALFSEEEMGKKLPPPPAPPAAPPAVEKAPEGQQSLGLDFARTAEDATLERERLKQQPQTPEVKARIKELDEQLLLSTQSEVEAIRADKEREAAKAKEEAELRKRFPGLVNAPDLMGASDEVKSRTQGELFPAEELGGEFAGPQTPEKGLPPAEPTEQGKGPYQYKLPLRSVREGRNPNRNLEIPARPGELTLKDLQDTGMPIGPGVRGWAELNLIGKTPQEVQAMVAKDPTLAQGNSQRAKLLRELVAKQPAKFKEPANVTPPAPTPPVEPRNQPGGSQPSVGVPSQPATPITSEPAPGVPGAAATPATPDGRGLVPTGQPAGKGNAPKAVQPPAITNAPQTAPPPQTGKPAPAATTPKAPKAPPAPAPAPAVKEDESVPEIPQPPSVLRLTNAKSRAEFEAALDDLVRIQRSEAHPDKDVVGEFLGSNVRYEAFEKALQAAEERVRRSPPAPKAEAKPEPKAEAKPEPKVEAKPKPVVEAKPEPKVEAKPKPVVDNWAKKHVTNGYSLVYSDDEVALVRGLNMLNEAVYFPMTRDGYIGSRKIQSTNPGGALGLTDTQIKRLNDAATQVAADESAMATQYPDGPFTGAKGNVVRSESVDKRYADYLTDLMQSLGLGNIKVFLYSDTDTRAPDAHKKYHLHNAYTQSQRFRESQTQGAVQAFNKTLTEYGMFLKPGNNETATLETISHELGHIIEHNLHDLADGPTRQALRAEYEAWLEKAKKMNVKEFIHSLRNREDAESQSELLEGKTGALPATDLSGFQSYWSTYGEWFADNVSRWATTNEKPLTLAEKFFSKVAQKMRDLVAIVTGRKYPPNKLVADFLNKMGPTDFTPPTTGSAQSPTKEEFSISVSNADLIKGAGPLDAVQKNAVTRLVEGAKSVPTGLSRTTMFRTQVADIAATLEHRLREKFDGAVRNSLGEINPMGLYRQAQDYTKLLLDFFQQGSLVKDPTLGLWRVAEDKNVAPPAKVYELIDAYAKKNGYSREEATQVASRVLEAVRLNQMRLANKNDGAKFVIHKINKNSTMTADQQIDALLAEYNKDSSFREMNDVMDQARKALVDHMVAVGRLSAEDGKIWKDVVGYVPFDRLENEKFAAAFSKIKKVNGKGLAQLGKLPELVGSDIRPVGNVFDNYINTLGWMVRQVTNTDATVQTIKQLESLGYAKKIGFTPQGRDNTVPMYVNGEQVYYELPSKYDVMAFKDLLPPKAGWIRNLAAVSNVLRKTVTVLPPFALKQVTDDVQRAILTSGVQNPGALLYMALTNFPKLAFAELRGIQHPSVKAFGSTGLTGEFDFSTGKPALSLLKDLGYKPRGKFETLLHRLEGITRASDLAVRKAIYDQTMKESNDKLLAETRAREFINFRRRGASQFVGDMVATIPFFNAYIQGMDVLYRAASGKDSSSSVDRAQARRLFWSRALMMVGFASLYAMGKDDEDKDYNEMDLRVRDSNWILPGGYKIPVPGELGAIFKVIPERVVEYYKRQGTPQEQEAFEAVRTALAFIAEQYVGRIVPVPQAAKPLLEAWANKSFLTGRELEGYHHKTMDPSMRRTESTSELAIAIADFSRDMVKVEVSPIMIDNALRGYFGSTAALTTAITDSLLNPTRVDRPLHKWALLSNYLYDPVGTRLMTEFYEERDKVGKAGATLRDLARTDTDRAVAYAEEHQDVLLFEKAINSTLNQLEKTRAYRKYLNGEEGAKAMSREERESELKQTKEMEVDMVRWLREAKVAMRNQ